MKKGDTVTIVVKTPVATTEENGKVEKITKDKIYIEGLDIPFEKATGQKTETFFGAKVYIKEIAVAKQNGA